MKAIDRTLYLGYYFKKMNWGLLNKFLTHTSKLTGRGKMSLWMDAINCVYKYNISLLEYFQFRFFEKSAQERAEWAGSGFMYEYQLKMNPRSKRDVLEDKVHFFKFYGDLTGRAFATLEELKNKQKSIEVFKNKAHKVVIKEIAGGCGKGLEILDLNKISNQDLINRMESTGNHLAEDFVDQHDSLNKLSSSALNTIRVITQIDENGNAYIVDSRLRVSVNSIVDNLAAGNIVVGIDLDSGKVNTDGVYSDITKKPVSHHPVSGIKFIGYELPHWQEVIDLTTKAAEMMSEYNKSVGWDIGITNEKPVLIEGNHDWCKLVWQLPIEKGLKSKLEKYY